MSSHAEGRYYDMSDWRLNRLPWGGKLAVSAFLVAIGVGYLFAVAQLRHSHGSLTYSQVVRDYYGRPSARESIDLYWANVRSGLTSLWRNGDRDATDGLAQYSDLLGRATSLDHLRDLIDDLHETELMVKLGIPSVAQIVSLGHTHTFGHAAFFMPICALVLFVSLPWSVKGVVATIPLLGVIFDYPAVYLTRVAAPEFAGVVIAAGLLMGVGYVACFAILAVEMWVMPFTRGKRRRSVD